VRRNVCCSLLAGLLFFSPFAWAGRAIVDWRDGVQVYSAPETPQNRRIDHLRPRQAVETVQERGKWVRVRYADGEGWVARRSLRAVAERSGASAETPKTSREAIPPGETPGAPEPAPAPEPSATEPAQRGPMETAAPALEPAQPPPASAPPVEQGGYLADYDRGDVARPADSGPGVFGVLSALLLVLALIAAAVYLFKLFSGRRYFGPQKGRGIEILATRALGPRQGLVLVEVGGLPLLLSHGEGGVHLVSEIRDPEVLQRLNDLYGFRQTPFEAELHRQLDLESQEERSGTGRAGGPRASVTPPSREPSGNPFEAAPAEPSPEERLAALRRRRKPGEEL
jgi:flagellar protein FliO/FliZ